MREILFRGKRIRPDEDTGKIEWVYGNYMTVYGVPNIEHDNKQSDIDRNTLGQYTGLKAKNGKIFEGDILSGQLDDLFPTEESIYEVVWHDYGWHIRNNSGIDTADKEWIRQYFKVIGNIHDNPELLER